MGFTLTTAAAQGLGASTGLWIVALIAGVASFTAAAILHFRSVSGTALDAVPSVVAPSRQNSHSWPSWGREIAAFVGAVSAVFLVWLAARHIDLTPDHGGAVIICIDSSTSTNAVRASYVPDLKYVVSQAARRQARLYAADCGVNATGRVDWPIRERFMVHGYGRLTQIEARRQADELVNQGLSKLVEVQSEFQGMPLGEVLAVMARQCDETGGNCTIYLFTDGAWADGEINVRSGVSEEERRAYARTYLPQLGGLAGSQVYFVGVGYGTSIGALRLEEARQVARELVSKAGGEMRAWATRL